MTHNKNSKPVRVTQEEEKVLSEVRRQTQHFDDIGFAKLMLKDYSGAAIRTLVDRGLLVAGRNSDTYSNFLRHYWFNNLSKDGGRFVRLTKRATDRPWIIS